MYMLLLEVVSHLQVLASVARNIDLFREQYVSTCLEAQGMLLWLLHLQQDHPSVYRVFSGSQNRCAGERKVSPPRLFTHWTKTAGADHANFHFALFIVSCPDSI